MSRALQHDPLNLNLYNTVVNSIQAFLPREDAGKRAVTRNPFCSPWCDELLFCLSRSAGCKLSLASKCFFFYINITNINNLLWRFTSLLGEPSQVYRAGELQSWIWVWSVKTQMDDALAFWIRVCDIVCRKATSHFILSAVAVPPEACTTLQKHVLIYELAKTERDTGSLWGSRGTFSEP